MIDTKPWYSMGSPRKRKGSYRHLLTASIADFRKSCGPLTYWRDVTAPSLATVAWRITVPDMWSSFALVPST